jgi:hypothetical protein
MRRPKEGRRRGCAIGAEPGCDAGSVRCGPKEGDDDAAPLVGDTRRREADWAALVVLGRPGPPEAVLRASKKMSWATVVSWLG